MKNSLLFLSLFIFCTISAVAQTPTFADPPGPEHVLVVYKVPDPNNPADTISRAVKDYYVDARNIPDYNVVHLTELDTLTDITHNGVTHTIYLDQQGEIIRDTNNANSPEPSIHSWIYFNDRIA
ncbi:MAG: hypothetical protein M5U17_16530 [Ignavibacterium sp.]|nr:hypothetical protein [Ignavibacterium sp.]